MKKEKLLISACLMGENVKYNGKNNLIDLDKIKEQYELIPFCPEVAGGLPTPRSPSEIVTHHPLRLLNKEGTEVTEAFIKGAKETLAVVKKNKIDKALLKANSPSCSSSVVYDGTFSGVLLQGDGVTTVILRKNGVKIFDENNSFKLLIS